MKLRNKKNGAIYKIEDIDLGNNADGIWLGMTRYNSLAELNAEWEDYEEPKGYWYYDTTCGRVDKLSHNEDKEIDSSIGNCFETREEAEKAVEKLKAWKRLKDKGFKFYDWKEEATYRVAFDWNEDIKVQEVQDDLDLLFGGEE